MQSNISVKKIHLLHTLIMMVLLSLMTLRSVNAEELIVAIDNYPPWTIIEKKPYRGIDVDIINTLAADLSLTVKFVTCPFKRCLAMLEYGQVDLMPGLFKTPEREKYMAFIEPAYFDDPPKSFYINRKNVKQIHDYEDLKTLTIGVKRGASYFEKFDKDLQLNKFVVTNEIQLLSLLKIGRIDTFISTESLADYLIAKEGFAGEFIKAQFHYGKGDVSYLAISKKSALLKKMDLFQRSVKQAIENNTYNKIAVDFYRTIALENR